MKKAVMTAFKILGGLLALLVAGLAGAWFYVNSSAGQQRLLGFAVNLLQEKLETRVQIDSIRVNLSNLDVNLWGVDVEDKQQRKLMKMDSIAVKVDMKKLISKRVEVESAMISGLRAELHNPKDSASNYQFIIDAFKNDKSDTLDSGKPREKTRLEFNIQRLQLSDIQVEHHGVTKKDYQQTTTLRLSNLDMKPRNSKYDITIGGLHLTTDNHQPRKNANKPKRGAFDAGHLDITADMELMVNHVGKDTANIELTRFTARDTITGLDVKDIRFTAGINKQTAQLHNIFVQQLNTTLNIDSATIQLPSKKQGRQLEYTTSVISGSVLLKDIARPFAPTLHKFSIPLELTTRMSGTDSTMHFSDVHVNTTDNKLKIDATGDISNLKDSKKLLVRFDVNKMTTNAVTAKQIIDQFTVKKFMMRQLNNLGLISYRGSFDVIYKMEKFRGVLNTSNGYMAFNLTLNEQTKYLSGSVSTRGFRLGRVIEMKDIDDVGCSASFTFDYSKPRTARIRRLKGGKLPIGKISVSNAYVSYKKIKMSSINTEIKSDGVTAEGHIEQKKKFADILCNFTFNNTDSIHKMKIKPGLRLRNMPWQKKKTGHAH